jgi:hypothetical protein
MVQDFQTAVAQTVTAKTFDWQRDEVQLMWDLTFIRRLSDGPPEDITEAEDALVRKRKLSNAHERVRYVITCTGSSNQNFNPAAVCCIERYRFKTPRPYRPFHQ